ncbi:hypothetical protein KEM52_001400 [Ascosphaera acerosa]|nr:hypothetical protein KEM52_001400 [Ascosphaera acerosa]
MASGVLRSGELMRLAPLLATTTTLHYAWDEHYFLTIFKALRTKTSRAHAGHASARGSDGPEPLAEPLPVNTIVPHYFADFFRGSGIGLLLGLNAVTMGTAYHNLRNPLISGGSRRWWLYAAGLGFTVLHFICMPLVMAPVKALLDMADADTAAGTATTHDEDERPMHALERWLRGHYIRTAIADVPGWLCFLGTAIL